MPTISSFVRRPDGKPGAGATVLFRPVLRPPVPRSGAVIDASDVPVIANPAGYFAVALFPGDYYVWVGASKRAKITVPDDGAVHRLEDLIASGTATGDVPVNYFLINGYTQILGADDGQWYTPRVTGDSTHPTLTLDGPGVISGPINARWNGTPSGWEIWNEPAQAWFEPYVTGSAQSPQLAFGPANTPMPGNARILNRKLQLKNPDLGVWHTLFISGQSAAFGPADTSS